MALDDSALLEMIEMLRTADGGELMRRLLGGMLQGVVDAEAAVRIGAQLHERTDARMTRRNGTREKLVTTGVGDLTMKHSHRPQRADRAVSYRRMCFCGHTAVAPRSGLRARPFALGVRPLDWEA